MIHISCLLVQSCLFVLQLGNWGTIHGFEYALPDDLLTGTTSLDSVYFEPYATGGVLSAYGDPNTFQRQRVNDGSPASEPSRVFPQVWAGIHPKRTITFSSIHHYSFSRALPSSKRVSMMLTMRLMMI